MPANILYCINISFCAYNAWICNDGDEYISVAYTVQLYKYTIMASGVAKVYIAHIKERNKIFSPR